MTAESGRGDGSPTRTEWPYALPWALGGIGWLVVLVALDGVDPPAAKELYGIFGGAWLTMAIGMPFTSIATKKVLSRDIRTERAIGIVLCIVLLVVSTISAAQGLIEGEPLAGTFGYAAAPVGMVVGIAIGATAIAVLDESADRIDDRTTDDPR